MNYQEIECRFLEIDKDKLVRKLIELGAKDLGEVMLEETIIYDKDLNWKTDNRFIRIRKTGNETKVSYKEHASHTVDGAYEIEFDVEDAKKAELLFEKIGLNPYRHQQKKRHTFELNNITFDIDTWPQIPTYLEIEAGSEDELKEATKLIGYDWNDAIFNNAAWIIENKYNIKVLELRYFTFDKIE
jgi:adenylate cyclase class 2